jgi:hypothetical protein
MSKAKFVQADTYGDNPNLTAWNNAVAAKTAVALTVAGMVALASANAQQIAQFTGSSYNGATSCNTFTFTSISDPHIYSNFGSSTTEKTLYDGNLSNFNTVYNTAGGQTTISTKTTGEKLPDGTTDYYNTSSTVKHAGWSMTTTINASGQQTVTIKQGSQTIVAAPGTANGKSYTMSDGTVITIQNADNVVVTQQLNAGGQVTTDYQSFANGAQPYMNIIQSADGAAVVSGAAIAYATGNDAPVLSYGCDGTTQTSGEFLGGQPTPAPGTPTTAPAPVPTAIPVNPTNPGNPINNQNGGTVIQEAS